MLTGPLPLVLLHGAGGSRRHWQWVVGALPGWLAPIPVDLPGHGDGAGVVPATLAATADAVRAVVHARCGDSPFGLAGHSMGGLVALRMAIDEPERVACLGLVATAARVMLHPELMRQLRSGQPDEAFLRRSFSAGVVDERVQVVVDDLRRCRMAHGTAGFLGAGDEDLHPELDKVACPTVVVIASGDPVVSPRRSRALAAAIAGSRTAVLAGGHYLHIERPAEVGAELEALCREATAMTPSVRGHV